MNIVFMSDSIVISAQKDDADAFLSIILFAILIQYYLLEKGILIRGGISEGGFFHYEDITYGPALVQAYILENDKACFPRIVIDEELIAKLSTIINDEPMLRNFIKQDEDGLSYLDSLKYLLITRNEKIEDICIGISRFIKKSLNTYTNQDKIIHKYEWLKNYYNITLDFFIDVNGKTIIDKLKIKE